MFLANHFAHCIRVKPESNCHKISKETTNLLQQINTLIRSDLKLTTNKKHYPFEGVRATQRGEKFVALLYNFHK